MFGNQDRLQVYSLAEQNRMYELEQARLVVSGLINTSPNKKKLLEQCFAGNGVSAKQYKNACFKIVDELKKIAPSVEKQVLYDLVDQTVKAMRQ